MTPIPTTSRDRYHRLVEIMKARDPDVQSDVVPGPKEFGSSGELKIHRKMFAFLFKDQLVGKLPDDRIQELVALGV